MSARLNDDFLLRLVARHAPGGARLLDYGAGEGQFVACAMGRGLDSWGVDTYAGHWSPFLDAADLTRIRRVQADQPIPFPDAHFDVVVSNMVFEHIENLEHSAAEIARVLKPGGHLITAFPTREVWWEAHKNAPLVHLLPPGSRLRTLCFCLSLDPAARGPSRKEWRSEAEQWLAENTFYRTSRDILGLFGRHLAPVGRYEADWLRHRIAHTLRTAWMERVANWRIWSPLMARLTRRIATSVFVFQREASDGRVV